MSAPNHGWVISPSLNEGQGDSDCESKGQLFEI